MFSDEEGEQAGYQAGTQIGRDMLLEEQIRKNLKKGKSVIVIAEELEETPELVRSLIEKMNL